VDAADYAEIGISVVNGQTVKRNVAISAYPPTTFLYNENITMYANQPYTFTFAEGFLLNRGITQDAAKAVLATGSCENDAPAGGSVETVDLGPDDAAGSIADNIDVHNATAVFSFATAGEYKLCYLLSGGVYTQINMIDNSTGTPIMTTDALTFLIDPMAPTEFSSDGTITPGTVETFNITGGAGLMLAPGADAAKIIEVDDFLGCDVALPAGGTSEATDLQGIAGPSDSDSATNASISATFIKAGTYEICYRLSAGAYGDPLAGASGSSGQFTVMQQTPTSYTCDNCWTTQTGPFKSYLLVSTWQPYTFTFIGGHALNLAPGKDSAKIVMALEDCVTGPSRGSGWYTDLQPDDSDNATVANATFTFMAAGPYKLCYMTSDAGMRQVGQQLVLAAPW